MNENSETTTTAAVKVKPVRAGDFVRVPEDRFRRGFVPAADSLMNVDVKVGTERARVRFQFEMNWKTNEREVKVYGFEDQERMLQRLGFEVDWTDLKAEYLPLAEAWQAEYKAERQLARAQAYDMSWAQEFVSKARGQFADRIPNATFAIYPSREDWMTKDGWSGNIRVEVKYRGATMSVRREGIEYRTYQGIKNVRMRKIETMLDRIKLIIDGQFSSRELESRTREAREQKTAALRARFPQFNIRGDASTGKNFIVTTSTYARIHIDHHPERPEYPEVFEVQGISLYLNEAEFVAIMDACKTALARTLKAREA